MKKKLFFVVAIMAAATGFAQPTLGLNQHQGKIIKSDGTEETGIIEADVTRPWRLQKEIKFFDAMLLEYGSKIKNKDKKEYGPKDLKGYSIGDKVYEPHKYADLSAIGPASLGATYFLERVLDGKIKLYNYYNAPPTVVSGQTIEDAEAAARVPILLIQKGDDKPKAFSQSTDLSKYIGDCPEVNDKYKKGEYGNKAVDDEKNKVGKFISRALDGADMSTFISIVEDYNEKMKGK